MGGGGGWGGVGGVGGGGGGRIITFMSLPLAIMLKTLVFTAFYCFFVQHTAQGCGAREVVTSIHAFGDHVQNTGIYSVFASLYQ